jgi:hypothetical protein
MVSVRVTSWMPCCWPLAHRYSVQSVDGESARRLANRAADRHRDGLRGLRGRRAFRRLVRAAEEEPEAADTVFELWLGTDDPDWWMAVIGRPDLPKRLRDLREDPGLVDRICSYALNRPELARLLADDEIVPPDPLRQAAFLHATGQAKALRRLDPDGVFVARVYAADPSSREHLPGVDAVRVLTAGEPGERAQRLGEDEIGYIADELIARGDLALLWELLPDLTPATAARAVSRIGTGWRPPDGRGQDLFALLSDLDPAALRTELSRPVSLNVPGLVVGGAFSPNLRRLAVLAAPGSLYYFNLWRGGPPIIFPVRDATNTVIAFTGNVLHVVERPWRRWRIERDRRVGQCDETTGVDAIAPRYVKRGGTVTHAAGHSELQFRDRMGGVIRSYRSERLPRQASMLVSEPDGGRLAVVDGRRISVINAHHATRVRHHAEVPAPREVLDCCFAGPDRLVTVDGHEVILWQLTPGGADPVYRQPLRDCRGVIHRSRDGDLLVAARKVLTRLAGTDLSDARPLPTPAVEALWAAPGGDAYAVGLARGLEVTLPIRAELLALLDRPMGEIDPSIVAGALRAGPARDRTGPLLAMLAQRLGIAESADVVEDDLFVDDDLD